MDERSRHLANRRCNRRRFKIALFSIASMACAFAAVTPPARAVKLGAHTLLTQADGLGTGVATSAALTTQASGSSLLVLVGGYTNNRSAPTDSYANAWKPTGPAVAYRGFERRFNARAYVALDAKGGTRHTVSFVKDGTPAGEITAPFVEIRHAGTLQAVAQSYPAPGIAARAARRLARIWHVDGVGNSHSTVTSDPVNTIGPATLVAVWWGDSRALNMTVVPGDGFRVIERYLALPRESGVQCAVAVKQVAAAGRYDVTWTASPAQGAILWLFAFQSRRQQVVSANDLKSAG
ncbi:hypothetical protein [Rhodanobacter sp. BL-MT-08]